MSDILNKILRQKHEEIAQAKSVLPQDKLLHALQNASPVRNFIAAIKTKHKNDYKESCIKIAKERDRFFNELNSIPFLQVKKSYSNYFLCKIKEKYTAEELSKILLKKHSILIKDCTGKLGIKDDKLLFTKVN